MAEYESDDKDKEHPLHTEIRRWKKARERYYEMARRSEQLYVGEDFSAYVERPAQLNVFWSIVNTLKPALYAQPPKPEIFRRYPSKDTTARLGSQILERCTRFQVEVSGFDAAVSRAVDDYLVVGQGALWVRYEPKIGVETPKIRVQELPESPASMMGQMPGMPPMGMREGMGEDMGEEMGGEQEGPEAPEAGEAPEGYPEAPEGQEQYVDEMGQPVDPKLVKQDDEGYYIDGEPVETLVDERCVVDYIHWTDLLFEPARTWAEVRKVARKTHITKKEFKEKFGEDAYITYRNAQETAQEDAEKEINKGRICVYEVWCKDSNKVYWLAEGHNEILKEDEPYLTFDEFFPCPEPLFATLTTGLIPRPDICFYQDQQETLNQLCQKAQDIARYIKVLSISSSENPELDNILRKPNGTHIQLSNFQMYLQQGGVKTALEVLSMADHAAILRVLHEAMEQEKQQIYDITGISDIVRGTSRASETLGAQQIKTQYAMSRISDRQRKVAKFCRDVVALMAQIIKNHFQSQTMIKMAGVSNDPEIEEYLGGVIDLLRNDTQSDYRIDIETDSTTFADQEAAKQSAIDLTNALGNLFNVLLPHAQAIPQLMPVINEITLYTTSQFEAGREIKGKLEKALTEVESEMEKARQEAKAMEEQQRMQQEQATQQGQQQASAENETAAKVETQKLQVEMMKQQQQKMKDEAELALKVTLEREKQALEREKIYLEDERERKIEELKHGREMLKMSVEKAAAFNLMPRQRTKTGRIVTDANGAKMVIIDESDDVAPEIRDAFVGIRGITGER
jgi:hypothetical protein